MNFNKQQLIKPILLLLIVIIGSVILVRTFTGGETLLEYADKNDIPIHSVEEKSPQIENVDE